MFSIQAELLTSTHISIVKNIFLIYCTYFSGKCGCIGDGYCMMIEREQPTQSDYRLVTLQNTIMETAVQMIKKHVMVGKTKKYHHNERDLLALLQKNNKYIKLIDFNLEYKTGFGERIFTEL